jgi:DNA polymerase III epsilon subunit family exonuclease
MFISLDLETTGFDANNDKIIEFGAVKFDLSGETERLQFLINPGITLPDIITHITGIKDEDLTNAPQFSEKAEEIAAFIGDLPIVGHNIQFDTGFLRANGIELNNPEYDTCQLASIMLPGLPSYSLEILSSLLELEHAEKHRAVDDSIAAMELFIKLADHFSHLQPELITKIKALCEKTEWELKDFLTTIESKDPKILEFETEKIEFKPYPQLEKVLEVKDSALVEIRPPYQDLIKGLSEKIDKDSYISIPNQIFKQMADSLPKNIAKIDAPSNYLSTKRLETFEKREHFEKYEFTALLKLLIWKEQTETGHLSEITFFNEEKTLISAVNIQANEESEHFFKKALEKDNSSPAICSHQYTIEKNPAAKELLIINSEKFAQSIAFEKSQYLKLDILISQLKSLGENETTKTLTAASTIIFGVIGLLFEKYNDKNEYTARCEINANTLASSTCKDLHSSIVNLIESSKALAEIKTEENTVDLQNWKSSLKILQDIFLKPDIENNFVWIEQDFSENIVIRSYPYSTSESLKEITNNAESFKIISENLDFDDDGAFTKNLLGLDQSLPLIKTVEKREDLEIYITQDSSKERDSVEKFLESYLPERKGRTAIIFNSKQQLSQFTLKLSKHLKGLGIKLVSQMTGSLGKIREQYKQDPDNSILFITPNFWENFKEHDLIDTILVHKIPFDPPSLPYITATSKNYRNAFIEFQIPRASFTLKKLINYIPDSAKQKEVVLLDSRLVEKDYGQVITENLKNLATTKIVNLSTLA